MLSLSLLPILFLSCHQLDRRNMTFNCVVVPRDIVYCYLHYRLLRPVFANIINNIITQPLSMASPSAKETSIRFDPIYYLHHVSLLINHVSCLWELLPMMFNSTSMLEIYRLVGVIIMIYIFELILKLSNFQASKGQGESVRHACNLCNIIY
jgi:hypothetical protein